MKEVLLILSAYLIGSIPTAIWVSRSFFGIDIREYGSGNAGDACPMLPPVADRDAERVDRNRRAAAGTGSGVLTEGARLRRFSTNVDYRHDVLWRLLARPRGLFAVSSISVTPASKAQADSRKCTSSLT